MTHALKLHPASHCDAIDSIEVEARRPRPGAMDLCYLVTGKIHGLLLPPSGPPARADGLWRHTCFEAFVRAESTGYVELNFAPSRQWAAYAFDGYRTGMRPVQTIDIRRCDTSTDERHFRMFANVDLGDLPAAANWQLGISAVMEETSGQISYWALAHPPGKPDFHHADGSVISLSHPHAHVTPR
jgi:hypothetical protein